MDEISEERRKKLDALLEEVRRQRRERRAAIPAIVPMVRKPKELILAEAKQLEARVKVLEELVFGTEPVA